MFYEIAITQSTKMLTNLSRILDKASKHAEAKKFDVEALLNSRLIADQFNLLRQVQIACDTAKGCAAKLTGKEPPAHEDNEKTLSELKSRVEKVVGYLNSFTAKDFEGAKDRHVTTPRWEGKYLTGFDFFTQHAVPNFYFHITTAYAILRHNGVEIGKKDYLGEMPFKK